MRYLAWPCGGKTDQAGTYLRSDTVSGGGVKLTDFASGASLTGHVERGESHAGLDEAGADGVDTYAGAGELPGACLCHGDDSGLGSRVVNGTRAAADAGYRSGHDDAAGRLGLGCAGALHGFRGILAREEARGDIDVMRGLEVLYVCSGQRGTCGTRGIGEEDVQPALVGQRLLADTGNGTFLGGITLLDGHLDVWVATLDLLLEIGEVGPVQVQCVEVLDAW